METAARILNEILDGVRTPERARSPVDAYITVSSLVNLNPQKFIVFKRLRFSFRKDAEVCDVDHERRSRMHRFSVYACGYSFSVD